MDDMRIQYQKYTIDIKLEKKIFFENYPTFILRSIMGKQLRHMCCVLKTKRCCECELLSHCIYAQLFETYIQKDTRFLPGRNRASHPYIFQTDVSNRKETDTLSIDLVLLGYAIRYFPYFYYAMYHAGEQGILRERIGYEITNVESNGEPLLICKDTLKTDTTPCLWELDTDVTMKTETYIRIDFKTPFRLKVKGKYVSHFHYTDLMDSIYRRTVILSHLYGENNRDYSDIDLSVFNKPIETDIRWIDQKHYSARQEETLRYGGIIGTAQIKGKFSPFEKSLLKAGELFNTGKNISFGLGRIEVREEG
jgi:hypothetical protein